MLTICLDPGHGGDDSGAVRGSLQEKAITLEIALAARRILLPKYRVVLTRAGDETLGLGRRVEIANERRADIFVSIHVNAAQAPSANGYESFIRPGTSPYNLALASAILVQFARRWPERRTRGVKTANFAVLRQTRPTCLIECFFLSNPAERALLSQRMVRTRIGEAIAWGCGNFAAMLDGP